MINPEKVNNIEQTKPEITVESCFEDYIPSDFKDNPFGYFEIQGQNIKKTKLKVDDSGVVRDDPNAVKFLPVWQNLQGQKIETVAKKVNINKHELAESGDPFYEFKIMRLVQEIGLPCTRPIARISQGDEHLIVMERANGVARIDKHLRNLVKDGLLSEEEHDVLLIRVQEEIDKLESRFCEAGIIRKWKLADMVVDLDLEAKSIKSITPTDWENTTIDNEKLAEFRAKKA